jgi:hypothetical protein
MEIVITSWAFDSYSDLIAKKAFTKQEYVKILRKDAELLKLFPHDPKFKVNSFWGPATKGNGTKVNKGYKMKWDSIGPGKNELRLCIAIIGAKVFLCQPYIKKGKNDIRECLNLERYINLIQQDRYIDRGTI